MLKLNSIRDSARTTQFCLEDVKNTPKLEFRPDFLEQLPGFIREAASAFCIQVMIRSELSICIQAAVRRPRDFIKIKNSCTHAKIEIFAAVINEINSGETSDVAVCLSCEGTSQFSGKIADYLW
ncbi:hypothetical protein Zmor_010042 [Zophobas morio]|uniref:Uncharacterized protein n=1 Tax=Zophobas morio TaxID=2755281 RepID=A0AA38INK1_9CUCU|nr:hypothetical protein Zmor_010042 [Zophobas morio]